MCRLLAIAIDCKNIFVHILVSHENYSLEHFQQRNNSRRKFSTLQYVGIVCRVLVLMIMFTDNVCRFTVFLLVELCPLFSYYLTQQLAPIMAKMM